MAELAVFQEPTTLVEEQPATNDDVYAQLMARVRQQALPRPPALTRGKLAGRDIARSSGRHTGCLAAAISRSLAPSTRGVCRYSARSDRMLKTLPYPL